MKLKIKYLASLLSLGVGMSSVTANADALAQFFGSRTFEVHVGYNPGGGYDTYARTLARHIGKHLPGQPNVVVRNVPGAGSLVLMNQIANTASRDGSVIGMVNSGMPFEPLFGNEQAQFDIESVNWVGNLELAVTIGAVNRSTGVESWQDLRERAITVGSTGAGSNTNTIPRVIAELFDLKMNVISGYTGSNDIVLAMERREVDGMGSRFLSTLHASTPHWLKPDGDIVILYQIAPRRHPDIPHVPLLTEFAETDELRQAAELLGARLIMGRPVVAPPGVPDDRLAAIRKAMADTASDPEFLADAENQGLFIEFVDGDEMLTFYRGVYQSSPNVIERIAKAME